MRKERKRYWYKLSSNNFFYDTFSLDFVLYVVQNLVEQSLFVIRNLMTLLDYLFFNKMAACIFLMHRPGDNLLFEKKTNKQR